MESKQLFITGHVALFLMLELILYIAGEQRAMILTAMVFGIFALIFFLLSNNQNIRHIFEVITNSFKPHHLRVKKIVVGNQKASNNTIIRIEKETKTLPNNEGNRNPNGNDNSLKTSTSCIVKIPSNSN